MATTVTKVPIAVEDLSLDTAGTGTDPTTFSRVQANGVVGGTYTKITADAVPVIDRAIVTSGRTPWAAISPSTDRDVEKCLQVARANVRDMKNFEHYGGTPGTDEGVIDATTAKRNTAVVKRIIEDLAAEGNKNGIYFPGRGALFQEDTLGGFWNSNVIGIENVPNLLFAGAGAATLLKKRSTASNTRNLFTLSGCNDVTFMDMSLDSTHSVTQDITITGSSTLARIILDNVISLNVGITIGAGAIDVNKIWITGIEVGQLSLRNIINAKIRDNLISTQLTITGDGGSRSLAGILIAGNSVLSSGGILVNRTGAYDSSKHKDITIVDNPVAVGGIIVSGMNEPTLRGNRLFQGGILMEFIGMPVVNKVRLLDNDCEGNGSAELHGTSLTVNGSDVFDVVIRGGRMHQFQRHGVLVTCVNTGRVFYLDVSQMLVLNCSRQDSSATDYAAIMLDSLDGTSGCIDGLVYKNRLRATTATGINGNYHDRGVHERGAGAHARNIINGNHIKGYVNASAVTVSGAGSVAGTQDLADAAL